MEGRGDRLDVGSRAAGATAAGGGVAALAGEDDRDLFAGVQGEPGGGVAAVQVEFGRGGGLQVQVRVGAVEDDGTVVEAVQEVLGSAVVEARPADQFERQAAAHHTGHPDQAVRGGRGRRGVRLHEVDDLADAVRGHVAGHQDGRVREVELAYGDLFLDVGGQSAVAAAVAVEQGGEHAGRVEPRCAPPVDGAVGGDQRRGLQVADEPVIGDRGVVVHGISS